MNEGNNQKQRGQSIILVAVAMVALVIFVALAVDLSNTYHHRRVAQNAADAAALAGAQELGRQLNLKVKTDSLIKQEMNDFAERNGIEDTNSSLADPINDNVEGYYLDPGKGVIGTVGGGTVPDKAVGIRAITHITAPTYFGGILGFDGYPVQARAAVFFDVACTGGWCMLPIAINDTGFMDVASQQPGQCFDMWDGAGAGNFGWVNWSLNSPEGTDKYSCKSEELYNWGFTDDLPSDCSAQCLDINMNPNYCVRINPADIGYHDPVGGTSGIKNGDFIREWFKYYITEGTPVQVLVYDTTIGNKKTGQEAGCANPSNENGLRYRTVGFACFVMTGFRLSHGQGATQCDLGLDGVIHCQECTWDDSTGETLLQCPSGGVSLTCDPVTTADYPGECETADGVKCEFETGDVNRISGKFVSCFHGEGGDCKAIGNVLAPRLGE